MCPLSKAAVVRIQGICVPCADHGACNVVLPYKHPMLVARAHSRHAHFAAAVTARTLAGTVTQKIGAWLEDRAPIFHMREAWVRIPVAPTVAARILAGAVQRKIAARLGGRTAASHAGVLCSNPHGFPGLGWPPLRIQHELHMHGHAGD